MDWECDFAWPNPGITAKEILDSFNKPENELARIEAKLKEHEVFEELVRSRTVEIEKLPLMSRPMGPADGSGDWNQFMEKLAEKGRLLKRRDELLAQIAQQEKTPTTS